MSSPSADRGQLEDEPDGSGGRGPRPQARRGLPGDLHQRVDVAVLPPFPLLAAVRAVLSTEDPFIMSGAQDLSPHDKGAHTGDVSGPMLCSVGCRYVTVGHSERRTDHAEDDAQVAAKVAAALRHGLTPILCVGEGLDVREAGRQVEHTLAQVDAALDGVSADDAAGIVIAYEPVWAIGTGKVATPDDAQEVCGAIRGRLRDALRRGGRGPGADPLRRVGERQERRRADGAAGRRRRAGGRREPGRRRVRGAVQERRLTRRLRHERGVG